MESFIISWFPKLHPMIYGDSSILKAHKDENELLVEDDDVRRER